MDIGLMNILGQMTHLGKIKNMETFKGKITEFVDWITGIDSLTGSNVTDDL